MHNNQSEKISSHNNIDMFRNVDKTFKNDPEKRRYLYQRAYHNLEKFKAEFMESTDDRDVEKFRNMKHNSTVLLNMFELIPLIHFLEEYKALLLHHGDDQQLEEKRQQGIQLFDEALSALNAKLST